MPECAMILRENLPVPVLMYRSETVEWRKKERPKSTLGFVGYKEKRYSSMTEINDRVYKEEEREGNT